MNIRRPSKNEPTSSHTKTVASEKQRSRALRGFLAGVLRFIRRDTPLPPIKGDLSSWILQLHDLGGAEVTQEPNQGTPGAQIMPPLAMWMEQLAGPELDPRKIESALAKTEKVKDRRTTKELKSLLHEDKREFESQFGQRAREALGIWAVPEGLPAIPQLLSFEGLLKMLRAAHALAVCLAIHEVHPLLLIARASKGDQRAVLDLIKVDKLFLHDSCTEKTIRDAELRNDYPFLQQLARAQTYQPRLRVREVQHLYFYLLFFLEQEGKMRLPAGHKLWRILDPRAREYDSLDAFERDFQRRRKAFARMLGDIAAETKDTKL
jgi:hypothetical protein